MRWVAWVLYENHRTDQKEFALHKLVCAMVDDELGMLPYTTGKIVDGMPRKGIDKLLRDCSNDLVFAGLPAGSRFAVVDGDELPARARDCLRGKQPPLDVLVRKLAAIVKASSGLGVVADGS